MSLSSRLGRLAAAAALVASGVVISTVATTVPSGAADTAVTLNCGDPSSGQEIGNSDTVTITVGTGCAYVVLDTDGDGGTLSVNGGPDLTAGNPVAVSQGDTVLFTAPASGRGRDVVLFLDGGQVPSTRIYVAFPLSSGSMVDNGDGSMTFTYAGSVVVFLLPEGSTCTSTLTGPQGELYILDGVAPVQSGGVGPSPAIISAGTEVISGSGPGPVPIEAGIYEACMYFYGVMNAPLRQSLTIGLGEIVPTTTTTAADDPVTPAYTG